MDITTHPSSDVIHVCNPSQESRIVAFMFTKRQLDGWRGYWDFSTSGNGCGHPSCLVILTLVVGLSDCTGISQTEQSALSSGAMRVVGGALLGALVGNA